MRRRIQGAGGDPEPAHAAPFRLQVRQRALLLRRDPRPAQQKRVAFNTIILLALMLSAFLAFVSAFFFAAGPPAKLWMMAAPVLFNALIFCAAYGVGGYVRFGSDLGWAFFQPGRGGGRFVRLQAAAWTTLSLSLAVPILDALALASSPSGASLLIASGFGFIAQLLVVTSLLAYQPPSHQPFVWRFIRTQRPDGRAYVFVFLSFQITLAGYAVLVSWVSQNAQSFLHAQAALILFISCVATSVSLTHGVGGPWLHDGYEAYMPGRGGWRFVVMQFLGWGTLALSLSIALARLSRTFAHALPLVNFFADDLLPWRGALPLGLLGGFSQLVITLSLLVFEEDELARMKKVLAQARRMEKRAFLTCLLGVPPEIKAKICEYL